MTNTTTHHKRKVRLILVALLATIAIVTGSIFAFFSDVVDHSTTITAGTLDLVKGAPVIMQNGTTVSTVTNFNPGDVVTFEVPVTNDGNKSAWVRANFEISGNAVTEPAGTGTDTSVFDDTFAVFEGAVEQKDVGTATNLVGTTGWTFTAGTSTTATFTDPTPAILNGTGADAETEGSGVNSVTKTYTLYFKPEAKNKWQGKTIDIAYKVEAMQYRNNATPSWTGLETK